MRFKNSIRLLFPNFGTVYKTLLYRVVIFVVGLALTAALILPNLMFIIKSAELSAVFAAFGDLFKALFNGGYAAERAASINAAFKDLFALIGSKMDNIVWSLVWAAVIFLVCNFLNGIANYTLGSMVNDHMTSLSHNGFMSGLVKNLKSACLYQLVYMAITIVYIVAVGAIAYGIAIGLIGVLSVFAPVLAFLVVCALVALEHTLFSVLMPALVTGDMNFKQAFRFIFKQKRREFGRTYANYFAAVYLIVIVNAAAAVFTLLTGLLLTIPMTFLFLVNMQFVNYYMITGKKYYIDYDNIVVPKQLRKEEKILEEMDI